MIFDWFDAAKAKEFGTALAHFFVERIPPASRIDDKTFALKVDKVLGKMADQIVRFKAEHKLNTYKKAQLGNAFKWALRDAGFAPEYTDQLTKWLMLKIS